MPAMSWPAFFAALSRRLLNRPISPRVCSFMRLADRGVLDRTVALRQVEQLGSQTTDRSGACSLWTCACGEPDEVASTPGQVPGDGAGRADPPAADPPPDPRPDLSCMSVVFAAAQPLPRPPMIASVTHRSVRDEHLVEQRVPVISTNGRTSTPGWCMSNANQVIPWCLGSSDRSGRSACPCQPRARGWTSTPSGR